MTQYTGSALVVTFAGTVISTRQRSLKTKAESDLAEQTAGNDTVKSYLPTLKDGDAELEVLDVTGGTAATDVYNLCAPGTSGTLIWQPEGTATGKPKHTVATAIVKSRETEYPYSDVVKMTIAFQFSAAQADASN